MKPHPLVAGLTLALASTLCLTGCGTSHQEKSGADPEPAAASAGSGYPSTVMSCAEKLTFTEPPKRVLLLGDTDASVLTTLDVLDKVAMRTGRLDTTGYDITTATKLKAIPQMESGTNATGGASVATESILDAHIDLVIGYDRGVDRKALAKAGVKLYSPDAYCDDQTPVNHADFGLVTKEVTKAGAIFGVPERAATLNKALKEQATDLKKHANGRGASIASLWLPADGSSMSAYGRSSMSQAAFDVNGLKNAYQDNRTRVFDISMEDLLKRNPDWVLLLSGASNADTIKTTFEHAKGASQLTAVKKGHVITMPYSLTDPASPLSIEGATELAKLIAS
ncbi:MAG: ABC transporter substrate-binding protein [Cutibacterium granulosum]|nr:ABC transporter substrate-binding protein [Cutibacterium granulosum]MDU3822005.1 ABC transporter substrate-binding protein [Cutibacterium granulosum]